MIRSRFVPFTDGLSKLPWWVLITVALGVLVAWAMATDQNYVQIIDRLKDGLVATVEITLVAFSAAVLIALVIALARIAKNKLIYTIATLYVEIIRGLPILVLLLYVAFVLVPGVITGLNALGSQLTAIPLLSGLGQTLTGIRTRDVSNGFRAVLTLIIGYSAFLSEVFRAGIEAVDRGQMEAARGLGMTYWQAMWHVVLRQAFRVVLPPLGNDFIAMLKDSSLAAVIGVDEITHMAQVYAASSFEYFQTYNTLAYFYLLMTLGLSMLVKLLERRVAREHRT